MTGNLQSGPPFPPFPPPPVDHLVRSGGPLHGLTRMEGQGMRRDLHNRQRTDYASRIHPPNKGTLNRGIPLLEFLRNLFSKHEPPKIYTERLQGPKAFDHEVVIPPESVHVMDLIWQASSHEWEHHKSVEADYWEQTTNVQLVSETDNPHEACAINVKLAGKNVGHLSRGDALWLHRQVTQLGFDQLNSHCRAAISGRKGYWTIKLDFVKELVYQPPQDQPAD